ncbi:hypothetical protein ACTND8_08985 [Atopobiaceae bacterium HCP3S3_F7]
MAEISALLGKPMFPWQRYTAGVAGEVDPVTGGPWYQTVMVVVQRRAGKTTLIPPAAARVCGQKDDPAVAWLTAQQRDSARRRWLDATRPLMALPGVRRKVSHSFEELVWPWGSAFLPFAPSEDVMHGEDPALVFVDELWSFSLPQLELVQAGYEPAWSVHPGQAWLMTAAGSERSTALRWARHVGREATRDPRSRIAYFEWAIDDQIDGVPVQKVPRARLLEEILAAHPRAGFGLDVAYVEQQLAKSLPKGLRAYGGIDEDSSEDELVIDGTAWRRAEQRAVRIPERVRVGFGVAADPELRQASVSAAWRRTDGVLLTEVIEEREQVRWVVRAAVDVVERWAGSAVAVRSTKGDRDLGDAIAAEMVDRKMDVERCLVRVSASDYAAACHRLRSGLEQRPDPAVFHLGERSLRRAVGAAQWGRGVWVAERGPIAPLESHTLAGWCVDHLPTLAAEPRRFQVL